ncbi:MAG: hypothetical protein KBD78_13575 [Oligoflexales bacterium]|nr:hypothetical protein [Oligoflexales bacterium]
MLGRLFKKDIPFGKNFFDNVKKLQINIEPKNIPVTVTPFTIFEFLGLKAEPISDHDVEVVNKSVENIGNAIEIKKIVIRYFKEKYLDWDKIKSENLIKAINRQKNYINNFGSRWLDKLNCMYISKEDFTKDLAEYLAYDRSYAFDFSDSKVQGLVATNNFYDLLKGTVERRNISVYRGIQMAFESLQTSPNLEKVAAINPNIIKKEVKLELQKKLGYFRIKAKGDLADTELVHFATLGFHEEIKCKAVVAFTCDSPNIVKERAKMYRTAWKFLQKEISDRITIPKIKLGTIIFCDECGNIAEVFYVKKALDLIDLKIATTSSMGVEFS